MTTERRRTIDAVFKADRKVATRRYIKIRSTRIELFDAPIYLSYKKLMELLAIIQVVEISLGCAKLIVHV